MKKLLQRLWPAGIIVALWLLFAFPYWGKGLIPFPSTYLVTFFAPWSNSYGMPVKNNAMPDVITQIYPWKRVTVDAWKHGEIPLWNPYSFSGTSHVGNYQSAVFSPVNALFFLLPEIHAWSLMILLQPVLAGLFMLLFLRSLKMSRAGSIIGALAFMFSGFIVVWMAYGTLGYAVLFLPLILYAMNTFMQNKNIWAAFIVAIGTGLSFVSGHFQMSLYVLLYAFCFGIYRARFTGKKTALLSVFFVFLGVCLAAFQILPGFVSYSNAVRSSLFLKGEVIPWQYIPTLFSPDFYGNPVTRNDWFGHYAEWASYIGVAPLLLSLFALRIRKKADHAVFFTVMALCSLVLAFQTPLIDLLFALRIPVLSTSSASRIVMLMSFSLATLAGFGFDVLQEAWEKRAWKQIRLRVLGMCLLIAALWVILLIVRPLPPDKLSVAVRNSYLPTGLAVLTFTVFVTGFFVPKRLLVLLPFVLIAMTSVDVYRFASKWMPFDPSSYVYPQLPVITKLQSLTASDNSRVFGNIGNEAGSAFGLSLIEGYDAVYQYRYGKFISAASFGKTRDVDRSVVVFDKHGDYSERWLQLLGVRYYAHKKSDGRFPWAYPFWELPQYNRIWEDEHFEIIENTVSLPRMFLASAYSLAGSEQEILDQLTAKDLNMRETIVLEHKPAFDPQAGSGSATISSYRTTDIAIQTMSDVPKLLFLSDVYDSGWRASVDGTPAELLRADFDFRAVAVPSGTHTVRMQYRPVSFRLGLLISGFATLILAAFLFKKRKQ